MATTRMVRIQKKRTPWTRIATPLVAMFPNSITLVLAGSWKRSPGERRMNNIVATITGPQSVISPDRTWRRRRLVGLSRRDAILRGQGREEEEDGVEGGKGKGDGFWVENSQKGVAECRVFVGFAEFRVLVVLFGC
ncbi:hypothetical protein HPP92_011478 [Vanilla planifolia]|uniref:Uncharacterized protein n=1 Tax=Vanilla planifolia TaxID=51239 RepID=A0A835R1A5_VANPL|nr:hypothetical protein HPP92_011774 [Vanilla planifolia]KAG0483394.1 hypothetical protein HPP92_011478 [Vanilla planifolia]